MLVYGSVCSGIESASVAFGPLGWSPAFFSEIAPFPSAVLAHHFPDVPNLGTLENAIDWPEKYDVKIKGIGHGRFKKTKKKTGQSIDLLIGGTPCQSFSIAGLRGGMLDPRGNLTLAYLAALERMRPKWAVWENAPGVLSSTSFHEEGDRGSETGKGKWVFSGSESHAFGTFLSALSKLGYGWAFRVLDARFVRVDGFPGGLAQRRRRVVLVASLAGWETAAAVLFERESVSRNPAEGFLEEEDDTSQGEVRPGTASEKTRFPRYVPRFANCLTARMYKGVNTTMDEGQTIIVDRNGKPRLLTPLEAERVQGFPDHWTDIPYSTGKIKRTARAPDGLRYESIGNAMPVNVIRWVGRRIEMAENFRRTGEFMEPDF